MTARQIPPLAGVPAELLLAIGEWVHPDDLPAGVDELLAGLLHRRAPAAVLQPLAALPRERVFFTLDEVLVDVARCWDEP